MAPSHPTIPPAALPTKNYFDPYNGASTGHQTAPSLLAHSTSWRASRSLKLSRQFADPRGGGKRVSDTVGAGSLGFGKVGRRENGDWDEKRVEGARGKSGMGDVGVILGARVGKRKSAGEEEEREKRRKVEERFEDHSETILLPTEPDDAPAAKEKGIFSGLTIYINGSTAPLVSDHRLKYLLVEHGASISIALGRRTVTHVILGKPNTGPGSKGCGGGLAGGKIEKEIRRVRGCGVKYVGVEWVLDSIKVGKRLGEAGFASGVTAPSGVKSAYSIFKKKEGKGKN